MEARPRVSTELLTLVTAGGTDDVDKVERGCLLTSATVELNRMGSVSWMQSDGEDTMLFADADRTLGEELVTSKSDRP